MRYALMLVCVVVFFLPGWVAAGDVRVVVLPVSVMQGEPALAVVEGATVAEVKRMMWGNKPLAVFSLQGTTTALVGIDLNQKVGEYAVVVWLKNGQYATSTLVVKRREKDEALLGIPEKLGGNSTSSQKALITTLQKENAMLASLKTGNKAFWTRPFRMPLSNPIVTDSYGYVRQTGAYSILHKGVDFRAVVGTPVLAMNRGVVRQVHTYRDYGKTVVIDHGLGVMTFYMHLSKVEVHEGELVLPGQVIALSGMSGYAESPHLHVSVRIGGVSVDPVAFLNLVGAH